MRAIKFAVVISAAAASASCGTSIGEFAFDAAFVASQAYDIKECREAYERTGDTLRLQVCETEVTGR